MGVFSNEQLDFLESNYVKKDICNDRHAEQEKVNANIDVQLATMNMKLGLIIKVLAFIAAGIGTILIGAVGSLIIK